MAEIARRTKRYPTDLTDEEWERIKPLLPKAPKRGRKISVDLREMLNAIRYDAGNLRWPDAGAKDPDSHCSFNRRDSSE